MLAGEPAEVSAVQKNTESGPFRDVESDLTMTLKFPNGAVATCSCSYTAAMNSFTATAERGSFGMGPAYSYRGIRGWRSDGAALSFPEIDHFVAEMDDFADCIITGRQTRVPGEEGLRDVRIMMAAYQAAQSGRPVRLAGG
jgi:predicted dehydrogenase